MSLPGPQDDRAARLQRAIAAKREAAASRAPGIPPRPADQVPYLGDLQRGLWYVHQVDPQSTAYTLCSAFRVHGPLDTVRLQHALDVVVSRHKLLRSTFHGEGDRVRQVIAPALTIPLEGVRARDGGTIEEATRLAARPFELERGPLVRASLVEDARGEERVLLLALHHILADERALETLWREIAGAYAGRLTSDVAPVAEYDDYVHWLTLRDGGERRRHLDFWASRLQRLPQPLQLPFELPAIPGAPARGRLIGRPPSPSLGDALRRLAGAVGVTPFTAAAFVFRLLLHRYTDGERVAFGTPVSTRAHADALEMIGYFLNALVVHTGIDEDQPVRAALASFAHELTTALAHADTPFDVVAAEVAPRRDPGRHPIFQAMFVYQEAGAAPDLGDARLEPVLLDLGASKFDLTLFVTDRAGTLETGIEYRSDRFEPGPMDAMLGHYEGLVERLAEDLDAPLSRVSMLSSREAAQVLAWESGPPLSIRIPELVPAHVLHEASRQPHAPALVCGDARRDYGALAAEARGVARLLIANGVKPSDRVAVFIDRSVQVITGVLGIQLAGAAYVPVDPAWPEARNRELLQDAEAAAVVTTRHLRERIPEGPWRTIVIDALDAGAAATDAALPPLAAEGHAYVLYTSGSTGRPKGVVITHDNLRLSTAARLQVYDERPERFLLLPSIAFDSSVAGLFWTLCTGSTLIVPTDDDARDVSRLVELIERERVTALLCVPSLYAHLLQRAAPLRSLRMVIVAGESCPSRLVADHFAALPHVRLFNEYGPTEGTVWASVHEMTREDDDRAVPIGRPIPGVRIEVRDRLGRALPPRLPGRATIVGPTVASGYWRRDDLTAERFANIAPGRDPAERRYRTGDRMAWTAEGRLQFLGREDEQVKLRGVRIEPEEIEAAILEHSGIAEAAVVSRDSSLVAFVTVRAGGTSDGWRAVAAQRLPAHMMPARVVEVAELPRLPNGKVDRQCLREVAIEESRPSTVEERLSPREESLRVIWRGLLNRDDVETDDNFFELGGHSLLVIQLVAAIARDFDVRLPAADVFEHPTVRSLAACIEGRRGTQSFTYQQLFPIQPLGHKAPFVMASPDFFTEALASRFRGERPVYGIRGVSLRPEGNRGRWGTMSDLAEEITGEIVRRFPGGPYVIAGYSFGAWVAFEIVRALESRGLGVERLFMIAPMPLDFVRLGPFRVRVDGLRGPLTELQARDILRHYIATNHPLTRGPYRRARQLLFERPWRRSLSLMGASRRRRGLPLTEPQMQADARVERYRLHATYRPGPVQAPTEFFNPIGPASDAAATWRPYFTGPLAIHPIPDPHDETSVGSARDAVLEQLRDLGD
jgi:amino acid adenylation domain-containing protein